MTTGVRTEENRHDVGHESTGVGIVGHESIGVEVEDENTFNELDTQQVNESDTQQVNTTDDIEVWSRTSEDIVDVTSVTSQPDSVEQDPPM